MFGQLLSFLGKYGETIGFAAQGISAVQSYLDEREAAKQTQKANQAMMQAAESEAALSRQDAALKAESARRDAYRSRSQQIASYLKSGVTLDGSPMLVTQETTDLGNRNAQNILTNSDYQADAIYKRAVASQRTVKKADFFGTAFKALGSFGQAANAYNNTKLG